MFKTLFKSSLQIFGISILICLFFSPQMVLAETCNGLTVDAGDSNARCYQASQPLADFISCLASTDASLVITSIGDYPSVFDGCVLNWSRANCSHTDSSCHYGGPYKTDGQRICMDGSHALDLRADAATKDSVIAKAEACGGHAVFEGDHVHVGIGNCGCDGWPMGEATASVFGIPYTPQPICFIPSFPIPGLKLNDAENSACPNGLILSEKGDAIPIYINALYEYAAGLAGVIAMFMIVFASWQWIMASGNAGKIDNAKDTIKGALLGLTLLFAGNLLLSNITKNLIDFQSLELKAIDTKQLNQQGPVTCTAEVLSHNCGEGFVDSLGANCLGLKCGTGECREVGTSQVCGSGSISCECREVEAFCNLYTNPSCGIYTSRGRETCLNDPCFASNGPCRWDDDFNDTCVSINDTGIMCGGNEECFIDLSENIQNSQYCCCNDPSWNDACVLRSTCSNCHIN